MKRIENFEDEMRGVIRYELKGRQMIVLDSRDVREYGAAECIRRMGYGDLLETKPMPVWEEGETRTTHGALVGTVPPDFDPMLIKSRTFLYEPRPGDFRRDGAGWIVSRSLGLGDLEAIEGFKPC